MQKTVFLILVIIFCLSGALLYSKDKNNDKQWKKLDYKMLVPAANKKFPCIIICPGRGYHKDLPLIKDLARKAYANDIASVTFNWSFFINKQDPSPDGSAEIADIENILAMVMQDPRIDISRVYIAGKSLGTLFAYFAFREHKELKGCILLTPLLSKAEEGESYYPELSKETRPVTFILGDRDSLNCPLQELYTYLGNCTENVSVITLNGGHSLQIEGNPEDYTLNEINKKNFRLAIDAAILKLRVLEYSGM